MTPEPIPNVSVIVPARNEQACLGDCLRTLVGQAGTSYEIIVVDDHSTDGTRAIAESFPVRVITADPLPEGWTGKCNAAWSGAKAAQGQWLLFTDADTKHTPKFHCDRIAGSDKNLPPTCFPIPRSRRSAAWLSAHSCR